MIKLILYGAIIFFIGILLLYYRFSIDQNLVGYLVNSFDFRIEEYKPNPNTYIIAILPILNIIAGISLILTSLMSFEDWQELVKMIKDKENDGED